jgi:hypothetical protein
MCIPLKSISHSGRRKSAIAGKIQRGLPLAFLVVRRVKVAYLSFSFWILLLNIFLKIASCLATIIIADPAKLLTPDKVIRNSWSRRNSRGLACKRIHFYVQYSKPELLKRFHVAQGFCCRIQPKNSAPLEIGYLTEIRN